jgi:predicted nucleotidyltransferase
MNYEEAEKHCIFKFLSGSHAYGTNRPDSDQDFRGVFIAPLLNAFELFQSSWVGSGTLGEHIKSAVDSIDDDNYVSARDHLMRALEPDWGDLNMSVGTVKKPGVDEELQELRKFLKLASESNPNIIEFLYVERNIAFESPVWKKIRANRHLFLSKRARHTFSGYAHAQLKRIETHRGYLMNPPKGKPERVDFGLPAESAIPMEQQNAILTLPDEMLASPVKEEVRKEKKFRSAASEWRSYKDWETKRNAYRKELESKWGFDVKHAMHLIRLSRMAVEILRDGVVNVFRPDADELKGILRGEWKYEDVVAHAKQIESSLEPLYKASSLRDKPDHKAISDLYIEICEEAYGIKVRG